MAQDALQLKEKIISFIKLKGPSLPVHVAKETGLSILFASAFLSELFNEKRISISNLKVGSSPLYFIPGQEAMLEEFSKFLKSREKDAFLLLKEKRVLKEDEQHPAIRVALKEIKDFAIPFKKDEEVYWRYFMVSEDEVRNREFPEDKKEEIKVIENKEEKITDKNAEENKSQEKEKPGKKEKEIKLQKTAKKTGKIKSKKKDENFFNRIKEFLDKKGIEILDIKDFRNNEAVLKIKREEEEMLFVFNTKKITEKEILKAHKKASESGSKYSILSLGEPAKKLQDLISAIKDISDIEKIE